MEELIPRLEVSEHQEGEVQVRKCERKIFACYAFEELLAGVAKERGETLVGMDAHCSVADDKGRLKVSIHVFASKSVHNQ